MGKYMRKAKTTGDVLLMDASLGVRTRAKTLALQRLHSSAAVTPPSKIDDSCYLELRSRRLEKSTLIRENSRKTSSQKQGFVRGEKENNLNEKEEARLEEEDGCFEIGDTEIEASCGENNLDLEARARSTRESTPCSFIRAAYTITTPGSSTKQRSPTFANQRAQNALLRNIPTALEMEEFFAHAEQSQQRLFMDKYNFDVVNDLPLPGRYEWVRVMP
ncbi:hypothetical protein RD792_003235 [Penstemon davidsonii]|uniref:Cyclin-dependent kinase inhibitor n=1 Tax=Penstemon davidsonii TaxID=160366 RepID=A0ABR0DU91_9LAMI|nr:hypothetical protein RD792_003235 [Penstemon davidsonii]